MTWNEPRECGLCGSEGLIRWTVAYWPDRPAGMRYEQVVRCVDRDPCRARVLARGGEWPADQARGRERTA